ncbi:ABC transporter permease [Shimia haliotis]|uniref:Capsular polysaccharide transport system permease protein n=1 Tax=Shimia haliotis TaxID=1280847 RepID=A0A1I4EK04_9RHOB|nr:ABC transporter permease [Shimia haliotis]SFL04796.1 capsular polysaccharide transport system permease protein [Shimia haliotis]
MSETEFVAQKPRSFRSSRTIIALVLREMSTTYGRTAFGYLWAILQPAAGVMLLTIVFSIALRKPDLGTNFPLFYASGLLPLLAFLDVAGKLAKALDFSRALLAFPAVSYLDALIARWLINGLTQVMVFAVVLGCIMFFYNQSPHIHIGQMLSGWAMLLGLGAGIGTLNCYLFLRFPFWEQIWGILTRPLLFISCVFYTFEAVPPPYSDYLWYNPMVHVTGMMRRSIYYNYDAAYVSPLYVATIALSCLLLGLLLLHRNSRDLLYR